MHINKLKRTVCKSYEYITELADSLEAPPRFELGHKGFADLCLTTWLWCRIQFFKKVGRLRFIKRPMERITRLELATSTLARWRSTR